MQFFDARWFDFVIVFKVLKCLEDTVLLLCFYFRRDSKHLTTGEGLLNSSFYQFILRQVEQLGINLHQQFIVVALLGCSGVLVLFLPPVARLTVFCDKTDRIMLTFVWMLGDANLLGAGRSWSLHFVSNLENLFATRQVIKHILLLVWAAGKYFMQLWRVKIRWFLVISSSSFLS